MPHILIAPSKVLCRLLCDPVIGHAPEIVTPGLALRNNISRACYALSHWKARNFNVGDGVNISVYSRRFMESSATALLLRVDPLRVLALKELQRRSSYQLSKRNLLAIQWSGDVISKGSKDPKDPKDVNATFNDCEPSKLDRALFSPLCSKVIWQPAVEELQNFVSTQNMTTPWQLEFLKMEPEKFALTIAGQLNESFSFFSKGIHSEWVDRRRTMLNSGDCRNYAGKAIKNIAFCAASMCCSTTVRQRHDLKMIVAGLLEIENEFGEF